MEKNFLNTKIIADPLWGPIEITDYLPMIDVPEFQALGFKYQLGVTNLMFPSATHTRKQHSFGAFHRTQVLADRWVHHGFISEEEARLMTAHALWHDIGHGPFSHVVEAVTKALWRRDHNQNGAMIIKNMKDAIEAVGIPFDDFEKMFSREHPLHKAVHDKNLGSEKLDYLARDAFYTLGEQPGVEYLARHTYFIDGELYIDEKAIDPAKALQDFYIKMYKAVYLRKNSVIAQRLMQKMVWELLQHEPMEENDFWSLTDFGLLGKLEATHVPEIQTYYKHFMHRDLPKTAIAFRPERYAAMEQTREKAQTVFGFTDEQFDAIIQSPQFADAKMLRDVENAIAEIAKLPTGVVFVVPPMSLERFMPQDIAIYGPGGRTTHLSDYFAGHFESLTEEGRSYTVLRIGTFTEHREALSNPVTAEAVRNYILSLLPHNIATKGKTPL